MIAFRRMLSQFTGHLPGKQAHDLAQRGWGAVGLFFIWANTSHIRPEMAARANVLDMAKSNLFLAAHSNFLGSTLAASRSGRWEVDLEWVTRCLQEAKKRASGLAAAGPRPTDREAGFFTCDLLVEGHHVLNPTNRGNITLMSRGKELGKFCGVLPSFVRASFEALGGLNCLQQLRQPANSGCRIYDCFL